MSKLRVLFFAFVTLMIGKLKALFVTLENRKSKVLFVTDSMHICGVREVVLGMIRTFKEAGKDISFIGARYKSESAPEFEGVKAYWLQSSPLLISKVGIRMASVLLPWVLIRIIKEVIKADMILIESNSATGMTAIMVAKIYNLIAACLHRPRKSVRFHAHTPADEYIKNLAPLTLICGWTKIRVSPILSMVKLFDRCGARFLCWAANSVIRGFINLTNEEPLVPTEFFAEWLARSCNGKYFKLRKSPKVYRAPLNIPEHIKEYSIEELYSRQGKYTKKIPLGHCILFYIGRVSDEKGIRELLRFFGLLYALDQKIGLVIIGGGDIAKYRKVADSLPNSAGELVSFFGQVSHDESMALNHAGSKHDRNEAVAITGSGSDTQGIAIFEQWFNYHAVIALANTCFSLDIDNCSGGVIVTDDFEESSHRVVEFMNDSQKKRWCGENGREYIENLLDPEKCGRELIQICFGE